MSNIKYINMVTVEIQRNYSSTSFLQTCLVKKDQGENLQKSTNTDITSKFPKLK